MKRMPILLWWKISHRRHLPSLRRYRKASLQSRLDNGNSCKIQTRQRLPSFAKILSPLTFGDEYTGDSLKQAAQKVVESHVNAYKEIEPEFEKELAKSGEAYSFEWDFDYTLSPVYNRNDFFCYGVSSSEYTGGAHGMYSNRYYTIDLSNWKKSV